MSGRAVLSSTAMAMSAAVMAQSRHTRWGGFGVRGSVHKDLTVFVITFPS
jgi:hypothetical protein